MLPILMLDLEELRRAEPIATAMLDDLRRAATYLEALSYAPGTETDDATIARAHAVRLWAASQAVERLAIEVGHVIVQEHARRIWQAES